ncbi:MAG TPA: cysteine dioxygenase family protein [Gemmatimonadota bacterium]|nr:cysteine dioxygenase family protein [Gemmatimonadota bacterium]
MRVIEDVRRDVEELVCKALRDASVPAAVERIRRELALAICDGRVEPGPPFRWTLPDRYARRLLCHDEELGYSAVVMTWGPGQRTPVHDHAGMWCVEGVVAGFMEVHQYDLAERTGDRYRLVPTAQVQASVGSAGCLIPPYEYHVLANAAPGPSVTLHIYGGEMDRCNVYEPEGGGWYRRRSRQLGYDA